MTLEKSAGKIVVNANNKLRLKEFMNCESDFYYPFKTFGSFYEFSFMGNEGVISIELLRDEESNFRLIN